jgi:tRNA(fMet)-specific endonuclease VapC
LILVDTTFLIDVMQNDTKAVEKARELADASVPIIVGTPTIFELYVGVGLSGRPSQEREKILGVLRSLTQLPLDSQSAIRAGLVYAQKKKEGERIDPEDVLIAGIAIENHETILTRNGKHFLGIPELKVEVY